MKAKEILLWLNGSCVVNGKKMFYADDVTRVLKEQEKEDNERSLRAECAIAAMHGLLSNLWWMNKILQESQRNNGKESIDSIVADYAVLFGDKLIERLEYPNSIKK